MNRKRKILTGLLISLGFVSVQLGTDVSAQEAGASSIEEIIVTANRREQSIQDVSGVVQSLSADDLREGGITELRQIQLAVPGLSIANQEGNVEIFIRGVGSANNTELGDPGAAPHLNGVYIPRPRGLGGMFYDVERVEINKGPQGTLYGRNAVAGTLNIITKKPSFDTVSGYAQFDVASRSGYGGEGAVDIPINDHSGVRLAGYLTERDYGFSNAGTEGLDPAGLQEDYGARLTYLNEFDGSSTLLVTADFGRETGTGYPGANIHSAVVNSGLRPEDLDLKEVRYRGLQGEMENEIAGIQVVFSKDFSDVSLEWSNSYRTVDFYQRNATSDSIVHPNSNTLDEDIFSGQFWQTRSDALVSEIRLLSNNNDQMSWSTGLFAFKEDQEVGFFALQDKGYCCYSGTEFTMPDVDGEAVAAYGDITFNFTDRFRGIAGLRYTDESKSRYGIGGNWALTLGGEDFACCVATRLGTEGFAPALLDRPNFDVLDIDTPQEQAQFLIEGIITPGARDTLIDQISAVAAGADNGECFVREDIDNGFVTCPADGNFTYTNLTTPTQQVGSSAERFVDWRIGFEMDLSDDHMLYGKISTGHKSGGFNDAFVEVTENTPDEFLPEEFGAESLVVYEIGSRQTFEAFGNPATFNATAFYYDYSDQVLQDLTCIAFDEVEQDCDGHSLVNRNLGESEIYGLEIESRFNFDRGFALDVYATLLESEIKSGIVADSRAQDFGAGGESPFIDLAGNRLPLQSDLSVVAKLSQEIQIGDNSLDWQILAKYRSEYFLSQFNENDVVFLDGSSLTAMEAGHADLEPTATTINIGAGFNMPEYGLRFEAYGQNITDEEISQKSIVGAGNNIRFLNDSRTYGLRIVSQF